jgi:hypothetical protein
MIVTGLDVNGVLHQHWPLKHNYKARSVAKDDRYKSRLTLLKREILPANDEKEEVGPLRRHIVKHGWPG